LQEKTFWNIPQRPEAPRRTDWQSPLYGIIIVVTTLWDIQFEE
jgi:hypothetical protein